MGSRIEGQVAAILNIREVAINRGSVHGVEAGMRFAILNRHGANIVDPETGTALEPVEIEKSIVKIVRVQDSVSVGRTFRKYHRAGGGLSVALPELFREPKTEYETLKTDEGTYKAELDEEESFVKVGDPVVQVVGEEFAGEE